MPRFLRLLSIAVLLLAIAPVNSVTANATPRVGRAFAETSYWNTPLPADAPVAAESQAWIEDSLDPAHTQNFLKLPALAKKDGGEPIFYASENDPIQNICANTRPICFPLHVPEEAAPANTSDGTLQIYDPATDQIVGMHDAQRLSDGRLVHKGVDRYFISGDGIDKKLGGSDGNFGHRGVPAAVRAVRLEEIVAGAIDHRLECFWHATAEKHFWPMTGYESGKGGIVPEGVVIRIKPWVDLEKKALTPAALVIAQALQRYGCLVGDNSGSGNTLKLEKADWSGLGLTADALSPVPFGQWEFIEGGHRPDPGSEWSPIERPAGGEEELPPPPPPGDDGTPPSGRPDPDPSPAERVSRLGHVCTIVGTGRSETLRGTRGRDVICGLGGGDTVRPSGGRDVVIGGPGRDVLWGGTGDDLIVGGSHGDLLQGGAGSDRLKARDSIVDRVHGGAGRDRAALDRRDRARSVRSR